MASTDRDGEALARLERRVADLEQVVRLLASRIGIDAPAASGTMRAHAPVESQRRGPTEKMRLPFAARDGTRPDLEQWIGSRGLLFVGVLSLLVAAGFFLKLAFDRGWIPPALRVAGAVLAGLAVALLGESQVKRGLRRYGLALLGAGGGLAYLGIWAAAVPYALVSAQPAVLIVDLITALVTWRAIRYDAEPLMLWALLGAYTAPIVIPAPTAPQIAILGYLALFSFGAGTLAYRLAWRLVLLTGIAGYFVLPAVLRGAPLTSATGAVYLGAGAVAAMWVARRRAWSELWMSTFVVAWALLITHLPTTASGTVAHRWIVLGAAVGLVLAVWWEQRAVPALQRTDARVPPGAEPLMLVASPLGMVFVAQAVRLPVLASLPEPWPPPPRRCTWPLDGAGAGRHGLQWRTRSWRSRSRCSGTEHRR